jgi:hypothetical protein
MAGLTAHGATFTFMSFVGNVTGISVESPVAELTDMTSAGHPAGFIVMQPTGAVSGGSITVDFLAKSGAAIPTSHVRQFGQLRFASLEFTYAVQAVCESASITAQSGDLVKGSMKFRPTDYYG